ncbi:MAG: hypothetical protein S4CHLAM37_05120 [Chlamydiia bacterium]|nr:hypothetical protein [Chlamydiia bacterium]
MAVSTVEQAALDSAENYGFVDYFKEVASNRQAFVVGVPKAMLELSDTIAGVTTASLGALTTGLSKLTDAEDLVFFMQDLIELPEATGKVCKKVSGWMNGSVALIEVANQVRKLVAHIGSTVGDFAGSIRALRALNVNVGPAELESLNKIGSCGSLIGSSSKLYDIVYDTAPSQSDGLNPDLQNVKRPYEESRNFWNAGMHVSIIALSALGVSVGMGAYPAVVAVASASLLGSRMVSFYRTCQLNAMNASHPQMKQAKI